MHNLPMPESAGTFKDWRPTKAEDPDFTCRKCGSDDVYYRDWDSNDGAYTDTKYLCHNCKRVWWVEGPDA